MIEAPVLDLQIQPLKGGSPLKIPEARMTKAGLETVYGMIQDHFLVAVKKKEEEDDGYFHFFTQRKQKNPKKNLFVEGDPHLALVRPELRGDQLIFHFHEDEITVPHMAEDDLSKTIPVQVWEYWGKAVEVPNISDWLSYHLDRKVKVARTSGPWNRMARQNFEENDNPLRAQDGYPVHAVSRTDVEAVFRAIGAPTDANRFRYQVLLGGLDFRQIHDFSVAIVNGIVVTQPKPCGRCEVPGYDQETGEVSSIKPLAGLARLHAPRWKRSETQKEQIFGENWLPKGETILKVGNIFQFTDFRDPPIKFESK